MFIGHFAVGLAAKKFAPKQSAATLLAAPLFLDILFPLFILAGVERASIQPGITAVMPFALEHMPWSHSGLMAIVWSILYGAGVFAFTKDRRGAWLCAALVFSHYFLDVATHSPDMQLWPGNETRIGLGLWYSIPGTLAVETVMYLAGCALYLSATRAQDKVGRITPIAFMVGLYLVYLGNVFGPPPPSTKIFASGILLAVILIPLVAWYDRHRSVVVTT